jgi:hypothetical protein
MKTLKVLSLGAIACSMALSFTSCNEDNPIQAAEELTITFENKVLNADGFWIGSDATEPAYTFENYGSDYTVYLSTYAENGVTLPITYTSYTSEWGDGDYWSGFAISNRTETTFANLTPDQYNCVAGKAHSGQNFCVITTYGEVITIDNPEGVTAKGLWFTNSAYAVNSILNGDAYSGPAFDATDWFTCTITGKKADGTTASVDLPLAHDGTYLCDWQYADLSSLGKVVELSFAFTGSRTGEYGLNTPAYICIDDITIEK